MKAMLRSTGDGMVAAWAVDLAVSKLKGRVENRKKERGKAEKHGDKIELQDTFIAATPGDFSRN